MLAAAAALLAMGAAPAAEGPQALIAQSRATLANGDFVTAYRQAEAAAAKFPDNADVLLLAANFVLDRYGLTAALPWYDRVIALDPKNVTARFEKAAALGDSGQTVEMLRLTREVLALRPRHPGAFILQALLAARAGNWELAQTLYYHSEGKLDAIPAVMLLRGAIGLQTGGTESAIAPLRALVDQQPGNRAARRLLALALWRGHDAQGTIDTLKPISGDGDAWAQMLMARACEAVGDRLGAAILLDRAASGGVRQPWTGGGAGDGAMASGNFAEAVRSYTDAANVRFTQSNGFRLIDALNRAGRAREAETVMATLVEQYPASLPVLRLAASDALGRGEWGRATTALALGRLRGGASDAQALVDQAWARFNLGDATVARDLAERAYALAPARASIAAGAGWLVAQSGDTARGAALLEKAVQTAPEVPAYAARLAELRAR